MLIVFVAAFPSYLALEFLDEFGRQAKQIDGGQTVPTQATEGDELTAAGL